MPGAARLNDIGSGHDCFPETPITEGSPDVIINGQPAARKGDTVLLHGCPCPNAPHGVHPRKIAEGSSTVIINGKPAARIGDGINCGGVIISGSGNVIIGDTPHRSPVQDCAKQAALTRAPLLALTPMLAVEPVFAKSCLRGAGCTDAGKEDEPQGNIGEMSVYFSAPAGESITPIDEPGEVKQYAQAAKKKGGSSAVSPQSFVRKSEPLPKPSPGLINKPQIPPMEPWYQTIFDLLVGKADAAMLPPPQSLVMAGTAAQAGATAAAGGAVAQANQNAAKALTREMKRLSGPSVWQGQLWMKSSFLLMGVLVQSYLKGEKEDLLTPEKLLEVAKKQGTVPSRVRYQWVEDEETGRLKAVGYHTSMESGRDQVRVRLLKYDFPNNRYEFWEDDTVTGPTILWTPDNPGMELPTDTAHGEQPVIPSAIPGFEIPEMDDVSILATPMPDEKDFRDYILVFPINEYPPVYVYLNSMENTAKKQGGELNQKQKSAIKKIDNAISNALKDHDIIGTFKDMDGNPVPKNNGGYWDHMQEMKNTLRGLRNNADTLKNVNNSDAQAAYSRATDAITKIESALKGYGI